MGMALFFGARNRQEYSYEKEFTEYQEEGVLEHIHLALSREQKEKIYVTHRLAQQKELLYDLIHEREGNLYLCGPGGNVPPQVRKAVIVAIHECGGHTMEYAEKYVQDMQINGRYNVEAWEVTASFWRLAASPRRIFSSKSSTFDKIGNQFENIPK